MHLNLFHSSSPYNPQSFFPSNFNSFPVSPITPLVNISENALLSCHLECENALNSWWIVPFKQDCKNLSHSAWFTLSQKYLFQYFHPFLLWVPEGALSWGNASVLGLCLKGVLISDPGIIIIFKSCFLVCTTLYNSLLNLLQYCFSFMLLVFWTQGMWDLNSPTRDGTCTPLHWAAKS